jgi:thiol-disulfide isomerase/thioredoxin
VLCAGCNNAYTLRNNYYRAAESRREAAQAPRGAADDSRTAARPAPRRLFPPYKRTESADDYGDRPGPYVPPSNDRRTPARRPTSSARSEPDGPAFPQLLPAHDDLQPSDGEIEQTSAQFPVPVPGGVVAGRVIDSSGRPQSGVTVVATATRRANGTRIESRTDSQGGFVLRGLDPGQRYLVLATAASAREPLIGRIATTAPDQDVVIEIARPYSANRTARTPASNSTARESPPARGSTVDRTRIADAQPKLRPIPVHTPPGQPPRGVPASPTVQTRTQAGPPPLAGATAPPRKKSMAEVAAENRRDSPWDMPAPPQRRTPSTQRVAALPDSAWQPAGDRKKYEIPKLAPSLLEELPADEPARDISKTTARADSTKTQPAAPTAIVRAPLSNDESEQPSIDPTRPLSQPLEFGQANATRAETPAGNPTAQKLDIELEGDVPTDSRPTPAYTGPKCEFDGNRLVEFQLSDLDGKPASFSRLGGRVVLIDFWGSWCTYCVKSMPHLVSLQRRYGPQGLQVVGIAYEQGPAGERVTRVREVRDQLGVNYPILMGNIDSCPILEKFGVRHYPTLVLVDRSGRVLWREEGPEKKHFEQLEKLLKTQLAMAAQ